MFDLHMLLKRYSAQTHSLALMLTTLMSLTDQQRALTVLHILFFLSIVSAFPWQEERQIVVGICAMTKKSNSKPMTQILERLCKFDYIDVVIFPEEVILEAPVEKWPLCDCLISFHSKGDVNQPNGRKC